MTCPGITTPSTLDSRTRSILKVLFLTLFLDLVGFSIIFPLYPSMVEYYLAQDGGEGLLGTMLDWLAPLTAWAGAGAEQRVAVLFGGVLGSLYALLQFVCTPIVGALSDRFGRRPVLLATIGGLAFSYLLWAVAGQFWLLLAARLIGGVCGANLSTASAVAADVTAQAQRAKGMALIGVAFGMGFIFGPLLGGLSAGLNLLDHFPGLERYGVNPFSMPALIAMALSLFNLAWVARSLPETAPGHAAAKAVSRSGEAEARAPLGFRTANPLRLFQTIEYEGVTGVNIVYFLFICAFSGVEFSLTFLAAERFGFGARENGLLLFFTGIVLVLAQGTYVQRRSGVIGPLRMARHGLACAVPAVGIIAVAPSPAYLYLAMFFMAIATAQAIPMLSALVSLYTPDNAQGRVLGVFRSLGALGRAIGPLVACLLFWKLGAGAAYAILGSFMLVPFGMAWTLPQPGRS